MYFHTHSARTANYIAAVCESAADNDQRVRIDVDDSGALRIKRGEGAWSPPIASDPDPYRDKSFGNIVPEKDYSKGMTFAEVFRDLVNMDATARLDSVLRAHYNKVIQEGIDHA